MPSIINTRALLTYMLLFLVFTSSSTTKLQVCEQEKAHRSTIPDTPRSGHITKESPALHAYLHQTSPQRTRKMSSQQNGTNGVNGSSGTQQTGTSGTATNQPPGASIQRGNADMMANIDLRQQRAREAQYGPSGSQQGQNGTGANGVNGVNGHR